MTPATSFRVLVVDDVPTNRRLLSACLGRSGYETVEAASGEEALELARTRRPDLVLLDVSMPGMDGFAVCRALKADDDLADVPVLFITALADAEAVEQAFAVGGSDYLGKPFRPGEVLARVAVHLQLRRTKLELEESHARLLQAQKLESMGQLAAGIAHEINTPIQYVGDNTGFLREAFDDLLDLLATHAELVRDAADAGLRGRFEAASREADLDYLRDEVPRALEQSLDGLARVSRIVRAMKEFAHPGAEELSAVDLNRAVESTATVCRNEWKHHAELELDLDPELPPVPCLPGEINQVLLNLIVNAAHAIAERGAEDGAEPGRIRISTRADREHVEIRVADDGCGIPPEVRARIFDPFFTTKGVGKGTGQGLAIAYAAVTEKHGGTIDVESEVGVGTTFVLRLPLARAQPEAA